jgi:hypothetical protein
MTRMMFGAAVLCAAALILPGCSQSPPPIVPAEGVVLLNGQPLASAQVEFVPMHPGLGMEYIATATTDEKGRFQLTCKGSLGACACENRVTVTEAPLPEKARGMSGAAQQEMSRYYARLKNRPIPEQYANVARSPLAVTVAAGQTEYKLELRR